MRKFCPACGKEGELVDGLCRECFSKRKVAIKTDEISLIVCSTCQRHYENNIWKTYDTIDDVIKGKIRVDGDVESIESLYEPRTKCAKIKAVIRVGDAAVGQEKDVRIKLQKNQCTSCLMVSGRTYAGILQVRGRRDLSFLEGAAGIVKIEEKREGINVFFLTKSDTRNAAAMAKKEGADVKETHKLMTKKNNKLISRMTMLARF